MTRDTNNKIIAGVCSGIAKSTNISTTVIRRAFAIGSLFAGLPILLYCVLWIIMKPEQNKVVA